MIINDIELQPEIPFVEPPLVADDANWYDQTRHKRNGTFDTAVTWEKTIGGIYVPHFTGSNTSNANFGALFNSATKLWVSLWFKLDSAFAGGSPADMYIFGKQLDVNNRLRVWLESTNGTINYRLQLLGAVKFTISSVETSWNANQWYHIIFSISSVEGARLIVDNGTAQTDVNVDAAPNGGDFCFGDYDDPGAGNGFIGEMSQPIVGMFDLTLGQERGLYEKSKYLFGVE